MAPESSLTEGTRNKTVASRQVHSDSSYTRDGYLDLSSEPTKAGYLIYQYGPSVRCERRLSDDRRYVEEGDGASACLLSSSSLSPDINRAMGRVPD